MMLTWRHFKVSQFHDIRPMETRYALTVKQPCFLPEQRRWSTLIPFTGSNLGGTQPFKGYETSEAAEFCVEALSQAPLLFCSQPPSSLSQTGKDTL